MAGFYSLGPDDVIYYPSTGGDGSIVASFEDWHWGYYAAAFDQQGNLYAIGDNAWTRDKLALIDATTGAWSDIGETGFDPTWGIAIGPSGSALAIQAAAPFALYSVDLQTAASTVVAANVQLDGLGVLGITYAPGGALWGVVDRTYPYTAPKLVEINPTSGAVSLILNVTGVPFDEDLVGIAFNEDGELFGSISAPSYGTVRLARIDLTTGAATVVGQPEPQADARALAFFPEPSTLIILILASAFLIRRR